MVTAEGLRPQKNRTVFAPTFRPGGMGLRNSRKPDGSSTAQGVVAVGGAYIGLAFQRVKQFLKKVHVIEPVSVTLWKTYLSGSQANRAAAPLAPLFDATSLPPKAVG
jgi:hypothetical protein